VQPALGRARKLFEKKLKGPDVDAATARLKMDVAGAGAKGCASGHRGHLRGRERKQDLYKKLDAVMGPDEVLATNTSSIRLETLRTVLKQPTRLVGLHFFNPVAKMRWWK